MTSRGEPGAEREHSWGRRVVTVSSVFVAGFLLVALLPLLLPVAALYDVARGTRLVAVRSLLLLAWFLTCEIWGLLATGLFYLGQTTIARGDRLRADGWFYGLERLWAGTLFRGAQRIFDFHVVLESGSDTGGGPLIVFARHTSLGDTLLPVVLLGARGLRIRYVMKYELRFDPCLDIVGHRIPNTFVRRDSGEAAPEIARVVRLLDGLSVRDAVVIFPEGTRFTPEKRSRVLARIAASSDEKAARRATSLQHVLPPRLGGPLGLLDHNANADVLFFAHTGFDGIATIWDLWAGRLVGATIRVFAWRVPFADIPKDRDERIAWLYNHWQQVDDWVGSHRPQREA